MDPAIDPDQIIIQNIAFEPEQVTITYGVQGDIRYSGDTTIMIDMHQVTVSRTETFEEPCADIEDDIKQLVLDVAQVFVKSRSVAEGQADGKDHDDDDEFRGMGE